MADAAKAKKPPDLGFLDGCCKDWDCCGRCRLYEAGEADVGEGGDEDELSATGSRGECGRGEVAGVETKLLGPVLLGLKLGREWSESEAGSVRRVVVVLLLVGEVEVVEAGGEEGMVGLGEVEEGLFVV